MEAIERLTKEELASRQTLIWKKKDGDLPHFRFIAERLEYQYFIGAFFVPGKIMVAAVCVDKEELTDTIIMFSDRGYCCKVAKLEKL